MSADQTSFDHHEDTLLDIADLYFSHSREVTKYRQDDFRHSQS